MIFIILIHRGQMEGGALPLCFTCFKRKYDSSEYDLKSSISLDDKILLKKLIKESCDQTYLKFSDDLVNLINKYSSSEEDKILVNEVFNSFDQKFKNKIKKIYCLAKNLKYFPVLRNFDSLVFLNCSNNKLEELDVRELENLKVLICFNNKLKKKNILANAGLKILHSSFKEKNKKNKKSKIKQKKNIELSKNIKLGGKWSLKLQLSRQNSFS